MQCIGITKKRKRCKKEIDTFWPFCSYHKWQPLVVIFAILNIFTVLAGLYQDLFKEILKLSLNDLTFSDKYIKIKIDNTMRGPFYNCNRYDLTIEISNRRSVMLILDKADFYFFNPNVQKLVGIPPFPNGSYYHHEYRNPCNGILLANESKKIEVHGPQLLPQKVQITISHSGSKKGTRCELLLSKDEDVEYWSGPKNLNTSEVNFGLDGLFSYQVALEVADKMIGYCELACALVMNSVTTKQSNGLDIPKVNSWFFLFVKPNQYIAAGVTLDSMGVHNGIITPESHPNYVDLMVRNSKRPIKVGTIEAIVLVNKLNMIYDNSCQSLWLEPDGLVNEEKHPIWKLPYIGKDYQPLFVDAYTGDVLALDIQHQQTGKGPPWKFNIKYKNPYRN